MAISFANQLTRREASSQGMFKPRTIVQPLLRTPRICLSCSSSLCRKASALESLTSNNQWLRWPRERTVKLIRSKRRGQSGIIVSRVKSYLSRSSIKNSRRSRRDNWDRLEVHAEATRQWTAVFGSASRPVASSNMTTTQRLCTLTPTTLISQMIKTTSDFSTCRLRRPHQLLRKYRHQWQWFKSVRWATRAAVQKITGTIQFLQQLTMTWSARSSLVCKAVRLASTCFKSRANNRKIRSSHQIVRPCLATPW